MAIEGDDDILHHALLEDARTAEIAAPLGRHGGGQVARASTAMLHLAGGRQAEPLARSLVRFHLGHNRGPYLSRTYRVVET